MINVHVIKATVNTVKCFVSFRFSDTEVVSPKKGERIGVNDSSESDYFDDMK